MGEAGGTNSARPLSALSSTPNHCSRVGDSAAGRRSRRRCAPRTQRTSLASPSGARLKCMPRSVPAAGVRRQVALREAHRQPVVGELALAEGAGERRRARRCDARDRSPTTPPAASARTARVERTGASAGARRTCNRSIADTLYRAADERSRAGSAAPRSSTASSISGMSPLCESYLPADRLDAMEPFYPLNVWVCHECFLVQLNEYVAADEIFTEYAYFSSFSTSWLKHASDYVDNDHRSARPRRRQLRRRAGEQRRLPAAVLRRARDPVPRDRAVGERVRGRGRAKGVPTDIVVLRRRPKAREMAADGKLADLVLGNNVLAQVPDLNDFVGRDPAHPQARPAPSRSSSRTSCGCSTRTSSTPSTTSTSATSR